MGYFNGPVTSVDALLDEMVAQIQAAGWTIINNGTDPDALINRVITVEPPSGEQTFSIWTYPSGDPITEGTQTSTSWYDTAFVGWMFPNWDPALSVTAQDRGESETVRYSAHFTEGNDRRAWWAASDGTNPTQCWIFTTATYMHMCWESDPGNFHHYHFGTIEKAYAFNGGHYIHGQVMNRGATRTTKTWNNSDHYTLWHASGENNTSSPIRRGLYTSDLPVKNGHYSRPSRSSSGTYDVSFGFNHFLHHANVMYDVGIAPYTLRTTLQPLSVSVYVLSTEDCYIQGQQRDVASCRNNFLDDGGDLVFAGDTYKVFPLSRRDPTGINEVHSGTHAVAYKVVA